MIRTILKCRGINANRYLVPTTRIGCQRSLFNSNQLSLNNNSSNNRFYSTDNSNNNDSNDNIKQKKPITPPEATFKSKYEIIETTERAAERSYRNCISVGQFDAKTTINIDDILDSVPKKLLENIKIHRYLLYQSVVYYLSFDTPQQTIDFYLAAREFVEKKKIVVLAKDFIRYQKPSFDPQFGITEEEMALLPQCEVPSNITIVSEIPEIETGVRLLLNGKLPSEVTKEDNFVVGFDCEWPGLKKYLLKEDPMISLIQLSNGEHTVLFRISHTGLDGTDYLSQLLMSKDIVKSGHRISTDANRLKDEYDIDMDNIFDMKFSTIAQRSTSSSYPIMVAIFLKKNFKALKTNSISNWATSGPLSQKQIETAAIKAKCNYEFYNIYKTTKVDTDVLPDDSDRQYTIIEKEGNSKLHVKEYILFFKIWSNRYIKVNLRVENTDYFRNLKRNADNQSNQQARYVDLYKDLNIFFIIYNIDQRPSLNECEWIKNIYLYSRQGSSITMIGVSSDSSKVEYTPSYHYAGYIEDDIPIVEHRLSPDMFAKAFPKIPYYEYLSYLDNTHNIYLLSELHSLIENILIEYLHDQYIFSYDTEDVVPPPPKGEELYLVCKGIKFEHPNDQDQYETNFFLVFRNKLLFNQIFESVNWIHRKHNIKYFKLGNLPIRVLVANRQFSLLPYISDQCLSPKDCTALLQCSNQIQDLQLFETLFQKNINAFESIPTQPIFKTSNSGKTTLKPLLSFMENVTIGGNLSIIQFILNNSSLKASTIKITFSCLYYSVGLGYTDIVKYYFSIPGTSFLLNNAHSGNCHFTSLLPPEYKSLSPLDILLSLASKHNHLDIHQYLSSMKSTANKDDSSKNNNNNKSKKESLFKKLFSKK
ncbi:hypothetical protein CYY_008636 [Polysphondylium violaceum]|uniref:3'-5' exonuclease n=1 Tax=Polysphondylium violaceum TaxID=133409 RepID=A0A8J4PN34_9MYCE|nr:hypothetical protein CYY_008636 [Polysphondylium violaceum]